MPVSLRTLCLVTLVLCNIHGSLEHEIPRRSFLSRRAIDGTRGRKYFDPEEEGAFDSYGSAGGQYDPYEERTDFSDIRRNVPGEPGADYPAYTTLPQTGFTCEGRSRGYYADEVAGCQVFHVCHDVLVSSFLCPMGSIFSQKLLTCDWWSKVDCSASGKYINVNRNSYQQDDDEMIRNAYAMVSLQSGTDVTKDGLVDPDRTGSVVDYQRGAGRIFDHSLVDSTGNDLRSNFEDYPRPVIRDFLPPYQFKERKPETSRNYQDRFYPREKSRSPYQDSPIIRVQKINDPGHGDQQRPRGFQESYRRPNEFSDQFQPSYAPTVPTVTTTTRRFYSPTVPTTFRPSTLAYNKLDQDIDSSEYLFSHSRTKSFVTPPTRIFPNDDVRRETFKDASKNTNFSPRKVEDYNQHESYEDDYEDVNSEEQRNGRSRERFQVRVPEDPRFNQTRVQNQRSPLFDEAYRGFEDEGGAEDIETRGSIGLGHALRQPFRGVPVQDQNLVNEKAKNGDIDSKVSDTSRLNASGGSLDSREGKVKIDYQHTVERTEATVSVEENEEETTEQYQRDDQRRSETVASSTTPSFVESTIKASTTDSSANRTESPIDSPITDASSSLKNNSADDSSVVLKEKGVADRIDTGLDTFKPPETLKPPEPSRSTFQIKVPDLSEVPSLLIHYSTIDDGPHPGTRTTELPRFQSTHSDDYVDQPTAHDEIVGVTSNYDNSEASISPSTRYYPTTETKSPVSSTGPLFSSSSSKKLGPEISVGISEPVVNYSDSSNDFSSFESVFPSTSSNKTEEKIAHNYSSELQFIARDDVQGSSSKVSSTNEISVSTLAPLAQTGFKEITKATTVSPVSLHSLGSTIINSSGETVTQTLNKQTPISVTRTVNSEFSESTLKSVTHRSMDKSNGNLEITNDKGELIEATTANALFRSIEPETLKRIEETIGKNNAPFQLDLTVSKDEELVPTGGGFKDQDFDAERIHLLRSWMQNLQRIPRPFSLDPQRSELRTKTQPLRAQTIAKDLNVELEDQAKTQDSSTESPFRIPLPVLKEMILDQWMKNLGQPLYRSDGQPTFDLPKEEKSLDFQTGLPIKSSNRNDESSSIRTYTTARSSPETTTEETTTTTTTLPTPTIVLTTESAKTVVKTEFVPSIGFSLDTDEGREEYVEAVLGGLIEPQPAESEKKETIISRSVEETARNETSVKV